MRRMQLTAQMLIVVVAGLMVLSVMTGHISQSSQYFWLAFITLIAGVLSIALWDDA